MRRKTGITLCLELLFVCFRVLSAESITLSNIEVSAIRNNSAVISWDSEIAATGQVEYGSWTCYGSITDQEGLSYWHSIEVTGLTEGTDYHFRIKAADCEGNETTSGESFFTTRTQMELHSIVRAARKNGDDPFVYYISPDGNDSWSGLSLDSAWASLSHAQNQLQPGDTLFVADGTYINDMFVAQTCGIPEAPITIKAYSGIPTFIESGTARTLNLFNFGNPYASPGAPYPIEYYNVEGIKAQNYDQTFTTYYESNHLNLTDIATKDCKYAVHFHRGCNNIIMTNFTVENAYYAPFHFWYYNHHIELENADVTGTVYDHGLIDFHTDNDYFTINNVSFIGIMTEGEAIYVHGDYGTNDYNVLTNIEIEMTVDDTTTGYECVDIWSLGYDNYFENFMLTQIKGRCSVVSLGSALESGDFYFKNATLVSAGGHGVYIEPPNHIASITLENLTIENVNHAEYYSDIVVHFPQYIDSLVFRDINGDNNNFNIDTYEGSPNVEIIEFTDNRVFSANYLNTSPVYYPDKSRISVEEEGNRLISYYDATVVPSVDSLNVSVIQWDTTGTYYKKWREICETPSVITSHTVGDLHPNSTVEVSVNSIPYDTFTADGSGWIAFDYTDGFSQDTVTIELEVISTAVEEPEVNTTPSVFYLSQNFPNPFQSTTEIRYTLPVNGNVELAIYNIAGQKIRTLVSDNQDCGYYQVIWDGKDYLGRDVAEGVYFLRLFSSDYGDITNKAILIR